MPLTKQPPSRKGGGPLDKDGTTHKGNSFSQARLDRICNSMQPLMTKHASEEELEWIFRDAEEYVRENKGKGRLGCLIRSLFWEG
jgi:hypothetical protein